MTKLPRPLFTCRTLSVSASRSFFGIASQRATGATAGAASASIAGHVREDCRHRLASPCTTMTRRSPPSPIVGLDAPRGTRLNVGGSRQRPAADRTTPLSSAAAGAAKARAAPTAHRGRALEAATGFARYAGGRRRCESRAAPESNPRGFGGVRHPQFLIRGTQRPANAGLGLPALENGADTWVKHHRLESGWQGVQQSGGLAWSPAHDVEVR